MKSFKSYAKATKFKSPLMNTARLDISIQSANKYLSNPEKKSKFLKTLVEARHKTDGLKITIVKKGNTGRAEEDYIVAYKNQIVYSNEYNFMSSAKIKYNSINNMQLCFIWEHLIRLPKNNVPIGTELFVEFLANKPTLSSNYTKSHVMVLIGYATSTYTVLKGRLNTSPDDFKTDNRDKYADEMLMDVPQLLFRGVMGDRKSFSDGIKIDALRDAYRASDIDWNCQDNIISNISEMFLSIESFYGGTEEGVVITYQDGSDVILKFQQAYQCDQEARNKIKDQFRGSIEYEKEYWENVYSAAYEILSDNSKREMQDALVQVSKQLTKYKATFGHIKKNREQVLEDIQITCRLILAKKLNSGALISGKFRTLTNAHYEMIREACAKYNTVTVNIVSSKETKGTKQLRNDVIRECFPNVEILNSSSGNLYTIMAKSKNEITTVIAGSDRVDSYNKMLENNVGMSVFEIERTDDDISASKVIGNLADEEYFQENTPAKTHKFYDRYNEAYGGL